MSDPANRRRSTRVEVLGKIQGQAVCVDVTVLVREISLGGMSIETPKPFSVGSNCDFFLTLGDGAGVELTGRIVYSRATMESGRAFFVSGIQFVEPGANDPASQVPGLIEKVT